jgi:hypothetical protein
VQISRDGSICNMPNIMFVDARVLATLHVTQSQLRCSASMHHNLRI